MQDATFPRPRWRSVVTICLAMMAMTTLLFSPAQAAEETGTADRAVADVLRLNPGSYRLNETSVLLSPGVVMTVPGPAAPGETMSVPVDGGVQVTVAAADASCPSQWLCMWQDAYRGGGKLQLFQCKREDLSKHFFVDPHTGATRNWRDVISSIWNNQTGSGLATFWDRGGPGGVILNRVGRLNIGNYLQDLTRDASESGGNWNDKIDVVDVCPS
jgi:hypothetical protein